MLKSHDARNPQATEAPLQADLPDVPRAATSETLELLSRPYPRSAYHNLLLSAPTRLPEGVDLPHRRRPALEKALAFAFSEPDSVRQLIVFVRAYALRMSGPEYAREVGLKANSYSQLEARGFDPKRSVASSFGCFLRDWERRADAHPEAAPFFRWAALRLERLLVGAELGTPLGFLVKCQNRVGTKIFAEVTGLKPEMISGYRSLNKNITFVELLNVVDGLSGSSKPRRNPVAWDSPLLKDARRSFFHHSLRLGRPPSAIKVHSLLTWAGVQTTSPGLRSVIPNLTDSEAGALVRFEPVSPTAWRKIKAAGSVIRSVPASYITGIDESIERESPARGKLAPSTALAVDLMRGQKLSTKQIARIAGIYDPKRSREGTALVRGALFDKVASPMLSWGSLAALLSRDLEDFERLISSREKELSDDYRRRSGHPIDVATLSKRIWGEDLSSRSGPSHPAEALRNARTGAVLARFVTPFASGVPSSTMRAIIEVYGQLPVWRRAHSSPDRLAAIASGETVPSLPEYGRLLRAGHVKLNDLHKVGWYHAFCSHLRTDERGPLFGVIQRRVLQTLVYEGNQSRSEALAKTETSTSTATQWFQRLDKQGVVPRGTVNRMLDLLGVPHGNTRRGTIESLLTLKEYPAAIREWLTNGMAGLTDAERRDVSHLMQVGPRISPNHLFSVAESGQELLAVAHGLKEGSIAAMPLSRKRTVRGILLVVRMFPGATLDDIREVFDEEGKTVRVLAQDTTIPLSWKPQFQSYSDRLLIEQGILEERPTTNFLPTAVPPLRGRLQRVLGEGVDRASFLGVLYPPEPGALRGDSDQVLEAVRQLINGAAGFINLESAQKKLLFESFKETVRGSRSFLECRLKLGPSLVTLAENKDRKTLSVREALDRLLTFLAFGDR